jgi:hypothetical protein
MGGERNGGKNLVKISEKTGFSPAGLLWSHYRIQSEPKAILKRRKGGAGDSLWRG